MEPSGRRLFIWMVPAVLIWPGLFFLSAVALFGPPTDAEKRDRIEEIYAGYSKDFPGVVGIEPKLAMDLMQKVRLRFVDVREPEEQAVSMLPGAIPVKVYLKDPHKYPADLLVGYCTIGYRSGKLAGMLEHRGITLYNLRGGILSWVHNGGKIYDKNGETRRIHVYGRKWDLAPGGYLAIY